MWGICSAASRPQSWRTERLRRLGAGVAEAQAPRSTLQGLSQAKQHCRPGHSPSKLSESSNAAKYGRRCGGCGMRVGECCTRNLPGVVYAVSASNTLSQTRLDKSGPARLDPKGGPMRAEFLIAFFVDFVRSCCMSLVVRE
jgi:hypothetical protein